MSLPQKSPAPSSLAASGPASRKLKKGELLFAEGENSRAMYFLKSGMIRLYKKKGDSLIELDTVHSGQVLGELAFLDGNPRSASGEALTDCELVEVSGPTFAATLTHMPDWLKILLKTVVGRLRTASTRIRQLETASTAVDYSDKSGKRHASYCYLSPTDVLKVLTGVLLVASRNGKKSETPAGHELKIPLLNRYANQVMGVPVAKVTTLLDVLAQVTLVTTAETTTLVNDLDFIEQLIAYLNDENLCEPGKRHDLTPRAFLAMSLISKHLSTFEKDQASGQTIVNISKISLAETAAGREAIRMDDFNLLVSLGYASNPNIKSSSEMFTNIDADAFLKAYRMQRIVIGIAAVNEQKRKQTAGVK